MRTSSSPLRVLSLVLDLDLDRLLGDFVGDFSLSSGGGGRVGLGDLGIVSVEVSCSIASLLSAAGLCTGERPTFFFSDLAALVPGEVGCFGLLLLLRVWFEDCPTFFLSDFVGLPLAAGEPG